MVNGLTDIAESAGARAEAVRLRAEKAAERESRRERSFALPRRLSTRQKTTVLPVPSANSSSAAAAALVSGAGGGDGGDGGDGDGTAETEANMLTMWMSRGGSTADLLAALSRPRSLVGTRYLEAPPPPPVREARVVAAPRSRQPRSRTSSVVAADADATITAVEPAGAMEELAGDAGPHQHLLPTAASSSSASSSASSSSMVTDDATMSSTVAAAGDGQHDAAAAAGQAVALGTVPPSAGGGDGITNAAPPFPPLDAAPLPPHAVPPPKKGLAGRKRKGSSSYGAGYGEDGGAEQPAVRLLPAELSNVTRESLWAAMDYMSQNEKVRREGCDGVVERDGIMVAMKGNTDV